MTTVISYDRALPEVPGRTPYTRPDRYLEKLGERPLSHSGPLCA